jgi:hypothetical protein
MGTLTVGISASADYKSPLAKFANELVYNSQSFRCASAAQWTSETLKEVHKYLTPAIPEVPENRVAIVCPICFLSLLEPLNSSLESRKAGKSGDSYTTVAIEDLMTLPSSLYFDLLLQEVVSS